MASIIAWMFLIPASLLMIGICRGIWFYLNSVPITGTVNSVDERWEPYGADQELTFRTHIVIGYDIDGVPQTRSEAFSDLRKGRYHVGQKLVIRCHHRYPGRVMRLAITDLCVWGLLAVLSLALSFYAFHVSQS